MSTRPVSDPAPSFVPESDDPWRMSASALRLAYAAGRLSPVEAFLGIERRMQSVQPQINAIVAWDRDGALAAARASERRWLRREPLSPMDGVPLTVKDNIPVRGLPCRWGSRIYEDFVPEDDEVPVARLRAAGAVLLGKTNVPEFTLLGFTGNLLAGVTRNPWNTALTPGGSSGGAVAAVAAGIGPLALATDGGGSIRRPCSHAGLVGLKPGRGRVPRGAGLPEMLPGMEVVGPIARTTSDLALLLGVIAPGTTTVHDAPSRRRVVYWRRIADGPVDAQVLAAIDEAAETLRALGHDVREAEAPAQVERFNRGAWPVISATGLAAVLAPHAARLGDEALEALLTPAMADMWRRGRALPATLLFDAQRCVRELRREMDALFGHCDLLLTPAAAALPWPAAETHPARIDGREAGPRGHAVFTALANACGLPALALPVRPSREGLPIGMQLVGPHDSDDLLCAMGEAWEATRPWAHLWPSLDAASGHV